MKQIDPIFLFSLPRSGSTLLQRILASHESIVTVSEPHLLLPLVYTMRRQGIFAEYGQELTSRAITDFCAELPNGETDYWGDIENFITSLYSKLAKGDEIYFLDKTPRYTLIIEDILRIFSSGKFIVLVRHPLAVVSSMLGTFKSGKWCAYAFNADLFTGLANLIETCRAQAGRVHLINYEELIHNPEDTCRQLFNYLELPFAAHQVDKFTTVAIKGLGDQAGIRNYRSISTEPLDKWKHSLSNPLRKTWCRHYLHWIGAERLKIIGYDLEELLAELDAIPTSLHMLGSDMLRMPYGVAYRALEPKVMLQKLRLLPDWHKINVHY